MSAWIPLIVLLVVVFGASAAYSIYETRATRRNPRRGPVSQDRPLWAARGGIDPPSTIERGSIRHDSGGESF